MLLHHPASVVPSSGINTDFSSGQNHTSIVPGPGAFRSRV